VVKSFTFPEQATVH